MQTFNDYLTKARIDFENKINSENTEYLNFHAEISASDKIIKNNLKSLLKKIRQYQRLESNSFKKFSKYF